MRESVEGRARTAEAAATPRDNGSIEPVDANYRWAEGVDIRQGTVDRATQFGDGVRGVARVVDFVVEPAMWHRGLYLRVVIAVSLGAAIRNARSEMRHSFSGSAGGSAPQPRTPGYMRAPSARSRDIESFTHARPADYEQTREQYGPHERRVRSVALLYWLAASLVVQSAVAVPYGLWRVVPPEERSTPIIVTAGAVCLVMAVLFAAAAWYVQRLSSIGQFLGAIAALGDDDAVAVIVPALQSPVIEVREPTARIPWSGHMALPGGRRDALDETLRLYSPVALTARDPLEDDVIGGYHIPAGSLVTVRQACMPSARCRAMESPSPSMILGRSGGRNAL